MRLIDKRDLMPATRAMTTTRRGFLTMSAGAAGGLLLGAAVPVRGLAQSGAQGEVLVTPFVHVMPDNTVLVLSKHLDMGQGTASGLATLVAEELDASMDQVTTDFAPSNPEVYANTAFGVQGTGGSTAMPNSWEQYRKAGATVRAMLVNAAASEWGVDASEIGVAEGKLSAGENSATFGELASLAASQQPPEDVALKAPEDWVYIGKSFARVDVPQKTQGSVGMFGIDRQPEDGLVAVTARPPRFGATLASVDATDAKEMDGVLDVLEIPQGVVVVAETTWKAMQARDALTLEWTEGSGETRGTDALMQEFRALLDQPGNPAEPKGDAAAKLEQADKIIEADYVFPYLAHAPMEPLDMTVLFDGSSAQFWGGSQLQTVDHGTAASVLGLEMGQVQIHTKWGGGSFGRRATGDAHLVAEAATIGKAWLDAGHDARPIKLVYTREDDIKGGYYRPLTMHRVRAGLDADGNISGWEHRIVSQSIAKGTPFEQYMVKNGVDDTTIEGIHPTPYAIPDLSVDVHHPDVGVPVLWWRSVGHTHTAYVMETMMDDLAAAAGRDPVEFRLSLLPEGSREAGVLKLAAEKAGWSGSLAEGKARGVAVHKSFNSYVAQVAEVTLGEGEDYTVDRIVCAVDCGVAVNPDNVAAQMEGGIGYGLGHAIRNKITLTDGVVDQANFDTYEPMRITDMPFVETHIVPSTEPPTGVGEPGTPPAPPAVSNALFAGRGKRWRTLPFRDNQGGAA